MGSKVGDEAFGAHGGTAVASLWVLWQDDDQAQMALVYEGVKVLQVRPFWCEHAGHGSNLIVVLV